MEKKWTNKKLNKHRRSWRPWRLMLKIWRLCRDGWSSAVISFELCLLSPGPPPGPVATVVGRLFSIFLFFISPSTVTWFQTVEFGSVLECDWKMRFIVPKNHPERKRTSISVEWGRKKLKLIDFSSQSWSAQTNNKKKKRIKNGKYRIWCFCIYKRYQDLSRCCFWILTFIFRILTVINILPPTKPARKSPFFPRRVERVSSTSTLFYPTLFFRLLPFLDGFFTPGCSAVKIIHY